MKLDLIDVSKSYGEKRVFEKLNLSFDDKKITCILGASGSGKTTLLNAVAGLTDFEGSTSRGDAAISYIFQKERLIPSISVYKNLDLVLRTSISDKKARADEINRVLEKVELPDSATKLPTELSGGEARRIAMARAFLYPSEILLMDEPFKGLDLALKKRLTGVFCRLFDDSPRTTIFVTHDVYEALLLADRIIVFSGSPSRIALDEKISLPREGRNAFGPELSDLKVRLVEVLERL